MRKNDPHIFGGRRSAGIINKRQSSKWSIAEFVLAMTLAAFFQLQSLNGASVEDVALLKSADRQKILVEGAKKEGKLSFYTTLIVEQVVRPLKDAFEKEYPLHPSRIFPRQLRSHHAKTFRRIPSQALCRGRGRRQFDDDDGSTRRLPAKIFLAASRRISRGAKRSTGL